MSEVTNIVRDRGRDVNLQARPPQLTLSELVPGRLPSESSIVCGLNDEPYGNVGNVYYLVNGRVARHVLTVSRSLRKWND